MPIIKQNVFIDPDGTRSRFTNDPAKGYQPAISPSQNDSEILIASASGFGVTNKVWDKAKRQFVYTYEVLDALPGWAMSDSDYLLQNSAVNNSENHWGAGVQTYPDDGGEFFWRTTDDNAGGTVQITSGNLGQRFANSTNRKFFISTDEEVNDWGEIGEGIVTVIHNNNAIGVRPTNNFEIWDRIVEQSKRTGGGDGLRRSNLRSWYVHDRWSILNTHLTNNSDRDLVDARSRPGNNINSTKDAFNLTLK